MKPNTFITAKGSYYTILDSRTIRWKGEELHKESDFTCYINHGDAFFLGFTVQAGVWVKEITSNLIILKTQEGNWTKEFSYSLIPAIGLCPLEIWGNLDSPHSLHVGNPIIEIW